VRVVLALAKSRARSGVRPVREPSTDDPAQLEETIAVLSDPDALADIRPGLRATAPPTTRDTTNPTRGWLALVAPGDMVGEGRLRELVIRPPPRATARPLPRPDRGVSARTSRTRPTDYLAAPATLEATAPGA